MNLFLGLGSNLGDRKENLFTAVSWIEKLIGPVNSCSSIYETEPWGFESENKFLNMVLSCNTELSISGILGKILMIEAGLGRLRKSKGYESREIDIDILFFENKIIMEKSLVVPHPRIHERRFVLVPLNEIAPEFVHPLFHKKIRDLLNECMDESKVTPFVPLKSDNSLSFNKI